MMVDDQSMLVPTMDLSEGCFFVDFIEVRHQILVAIVWSKGGAFAISGIGVGDVAVVDDIFEDVLGDGVGWPVQPIA